MKTKFFMGLAALALLASACQKEDLKGSEGIQNGVKTYTAVMEQPVDETKASVAIDGNTAKFAWTNGDPIHVIALKEEGATYGKASGITLTVADGSNKGTFTLPAGFSKPTYAVYPDILPSAGFDTDGNLTKVNLAVTHKNYAGSVNAAMYTMFNGSESSTDELTFKHLAGVLQVTIKNVPVGCDKFIVRAAEGIYINGCFDVDLTDAEPQITLEDSWTDNDKYKRFNNTTCQFTATTTVQDMTFYVPLPVGTYETLTVELMAGEVQKLTKTTAQPNSIKRGQLAVLPDLTYVDQSVDLSAVGTANCYIVSAAGDYKFTATHKGNSTADADKLGTIDKAEVLWECHDDYSKETTVGELVKNVGYADGSVYLTTTGVNGNAVIAVKDADGVILWSWHIWLTAESPQNQEYNNSAGTMMDRNLGAMSASSDAGQLAHGLFYQWGRKDPFLGASLKDNSKPEFSTNKDNWNTDTNANAGTVAAAIKNPMTFITTTDETTAGNWLSTHDNNLWKSAKTVSDPCPYGYRIPSGQSSGLYNTAMGKTSGDYSLYNDDKKGADFGGATSSGYLSSESCWYPAAGYISNSGEYKTGSATYFACGVNSDKSVSAFYFNSSKYYPNNKKARVLGASVRCFKIQ